MIASYRIKLVQTSRIWRYWCHQSPLWSPCSHIYSQLMGEKCSDGSYPESLLHKTSRILVHVDYCGENWEKQTWSSHPPVYNSSNVGRCIGRPVAIKNLRLMLVYLIPAETWVLSVTVLFGAPIPLIHSSYTSGAANSLCIRENLSNLEFLKAIIWKHVYPLMDFTDAKNVSEYITSFMWCGLRAHTLVF